MKVQENYFYKLDNSKEVKVIWKKHDKACVLELGVEYPTAIVDIDRLTGIELTDEWLGKLGFNLTKTCYELKGMSMLFYDGWNLNYDKGHDDYSATGFWDVHEFQNLYSALTREELVFSDAVS